MPSFEWSCGGYSAAGLHRYSRLFPDAPGEYTSTSRTQRAAIPISSGVVWPAGRRGPVAGVLTGVRHRQRQLVSGSPINKAVVSRRPMPQVQQLGLSLTTNSWSTYRAPRRAPATAAPAPCGAVSTDVSRRAHSHENDTEKGCRLQVSQEPFNVKKAHVAAMVTGAHRPRVSYNEFCFFSASLSRWRFMSACSCWCSHAAPCSCSFSRPSPSSLEAACGGSSGVLTGHDSDMTLLRPMSDAQLVVRSRKRVFSARAS